MSKPIAVLVADVHYNVHTLPLADAAMRQAITKANELDIPLIVAGDLHDTKANLRAECVNAMIETFKKCETDCFILRGNHDSINEKSTQHSLNFLHGYARVVSAGPLWGDKVKAWLLPYYSDVEILRSDISGIGALKSTGHPLTLIMHQGLKEANAGDYIHDKSAITHDDVKDFRVISGHYHTRQDIKTGRPRTGAVGLFSYIGSPYTLGFGEANDPPKGFQILMDDGTLEFVPTNLRQHHIYEIEAKDLGVRPTVAYNSGDLVWVKVTGTKEELIKLDKSKVSKLLNLKQDFKLDLIPTNTETQLLDNSKQLTQGETLDALIDSLSATSDERKARLKELWKAAVCG